MTYEAPNQHPIFEACLKGDTEAVAAHLKDGVDPYLNGVLSSAIRGGHLLVLETFLESGLDLNKPFNDEGETPIFRAIERKNLSVIEYFLRKGANPNSKDAFGRTPLLLAASWYPACVNILMKYGADPKARSNDGLSAMHCASGSNFTEVLKDLHKADVDIDSKDDQGTTPLIAAAKAGSLQALEWLLDHGADINAKDGRGKTALQWAETNRHTAVAEVLRQRGAN